MSSHACNVATYCCCQYSCSSANLLKDRNLRCIFLSFAKKQNDEKKNALIVWMLENRRFFFPFSVRRTHTCLNLVGPKPCKTWPFAMGSSTWHDLSKIYYSFFFTVLVHIWQNWTRCNNASECRKNHQTCDPHELMFKTFADQGAQAVALKKVKWYYSFASCPFTFHKIVVAKPNTNTTNNKAPKQQWIRTWQKWIPSVASTWPPSLQSTE